MPNNKKTINITCTGAGLAKLDDLVPLQGNLKKLEREQYAKLKRALLEHGFSFPFFVWKNKDRLMILDGHQRDRVLRRLKNQGYEIPPLPVDYIEARSEKEAREKILLISSQYGQMNADTVMEFLKESDIDLDDLLYKVELPQVDIEKLAQQLEEDVRNAKDPQETDSQFQVIVECRDEDQQLKLIEKLERQKYTCRALIL